jgi:hypothetical protein
MKSIENINKLNKLSATCLPNRQAFAATEEVLYVLYPNRNKQVGFIA